QNVDHPPVGLLRKLPDHVTTRPFESLLRVRRFGRIDTSRKQGFEGRIDARTTHRFLHQRIEAERWEVSLVEDDRVPQCNRLAVVRLVYEQIEQGLRAVAVASIPGHQPGAIDREGSYGLEGHRFVTPACKIRARSQEPRWLHV